MYAKLVFEVAPPPKLAVTEYAVPEAANSVAELIGQLKVAAKVPLLVKVSSVHKVVARPGPSPCPSGCRHR